MPCLLGGFFLHTESFRPLARLHLGLIPKAHLPGYSYLVPVLCARIGMDFIMHYRLISFFLMAEILSLLPSKSTLPLRAMCRHWSSGEPDCSECHLAPFDMGSYSPGKCSWHSVFHCLSMSKGCLLNLRGDVIWFCLCESRVIHDIGLLLLCRLHHFHKTETSDQSCTFQKIQIQNSGFWSTKNSLMSLSWTVHHCLLIIKFLTYTHKYLRHTTLFTLNATVQYYTMRMVSWWLTLAYAYLLKQSFCGLNATFHVGTLDQNEEDS